MVDISDNEINAQNRDYDYDFSVQDFDSDLTVRTKKIKLMDVKGAKITGALDFIIQFEKLSNIVDGSALYVGKIENINIRIKPVLDSALRDSNQLSLDLKKTIDDLYSKMVLIYKGSDDVLGLGEIKKLKFSMKEDEFYAIYPNYNENWGFYEKLIVAKKESENNLLNTQKLIKNINSYLKKMDQYFKAKYK